VLCSGIKVAKEIALYTVERAGDAGFAGIQFGPQRATTMWDGTLSGTEFHSESLAFLALWNGAESIRYRWEWQPWAHSTVQYILPRPLRLPSTCYKLLIVVTLCTSYTKKMESPNTPPRHLDLLSSSFLFFLSTCVHRRFLVGRRILDA
jgi:hypothetical protein